MIARYGILTADVEWVTLFINWQFKVHASITMTERLATQLFIIKQFLKHLYGYYYSLWKHK